jgi:hypothetical protein
MSYAPCSRQSVDFISEALSAIWGEAVIQMAVLTHQ